MAQLIPPLLIEGDAPPGANPHLTLLTSPRDLLAPPRPTAHPRVEVKGSRPPRLTRRRLSLSITCSSLGAARRPRERQKGQKRGVGGRGGHHHLLALHNLFEDLLCQGLRCRA